MGVSTGDGAEKDRPVPIRSAVLSLVLGAPCGDFRSTAIIPVEPVVAARCLVWRSGTA